MDKVIDIIAASRIDQSMKHFSTIIHDRQKIEFTKQNLVSLIDSLIEKLRGSSELTDEVMQLLGELSSINKMDDANNDKVNNLINLLDYCGLKLLLVIRNDLTEVDLPQLIRSYTVYKPLLEDNLVGQKYLVSGISNSYENTRDLSLSNLCMDFLTSSKIDIPISEEQRSLINLPTSINDYVKLNDMGASKEFDGSKIEYLLGLFGFNFFYLI